MQEFLQIYFRKLLWGWFHAQNFHGKGESFTVFRGFLEGIGYALTNCSRLSKLFVEFNRLAVDNPFRLMYNAGVQGEEPLQPQSFLMKGFICV